MPVPPPAVTAPYDSVESVLNVARTRLNDAIQSSAGDILTDNQPFTGTMFNSAWRKMQAYLANLGYSRYKKKFWAYQMPKVASQDPSSECFWSWTQFFDGVGYWAPPETTVLPQDFIAPLVLKERQNGSNAPFAPMKLCPDGLPEGQKRPWNGFFEWKNDAIYMPGSTFYMDFEVEYAAFGQDFAVNEDGSILNPSSAFVPIMRSQSPLANYVCAEMALGRDDIDGQKFISEAQSDCQLLVNNSDVKLRQRRPVQRRSYGGRRGLGSAVRGYLGY